jgi:hypothetical protein
MQCAYFTNLDTYNEFCELISRAWRVAVPECKEHVHCSFIKWLHVKGEEGAARWFENQWEGKSWMLCDIGYSMACGNNGGRKNLNLPYSLSLLAQYMEDHSERLESRAIAHGIKHTSFQRTPELTCHHWDLLQRLDQQTLLLTYCQSKSAAYTALICKDDAKPDEEAHQVNSVNTGRMQGNGPGQRRGGAD